jgi:hypothetical protein
MPVADGATFVILTAAALLMFVFGDDGDQAPRPRPIQSGTITMRQQIIIRVPAGIRRVTPAGRTLIQWEEGRGPRCVAAGRIIGAALLGQDSVDLIFRDNTRMRARFERRCPALDFYGGFYVNATVDGQICADRDSIRSRTGGECQIDQFRSLRAARP